MSYEIRDVINKLNELSVKNKDAFKVAFRVIAGVEMNSRCVPLGVDALSSLESKFMGTSDEDDCVWFTCEVYANALSVISAQVGKPMYYSIDSAPTLAKSSGASSFEKISQEDMFITMFDRYLGLEDAFDGEKGEAVDIPEDEYDEEKAAESVLEALNFSEDDEPNDGSTELENKTDEIDGQKSETDSELDREFDEIYADQCTGSIDEIKKVYDDLFASGYEVKKPFGMLTSEGIVGLTSVHGDTKLVGNSGSTTATSSAKILKRPMGILAMHEYLNGRIGFMEISDRSISKVSEWIVNEFKGSRRLLYFPNKMLEFAFGRKTPTGENQNSLNTYTAQSVANSWESYWFNEVKKGLDSLVLRSAKSLFMSLKKAGADSKDIRDRIKEFLAYFMECLSFCILVTEYRDSNGAMVSLKFRVSDIRNALGYDNIMTPILSECFINVIGSDPKTYDVAVYASGVKEYGHDFNYKTSQAMPLFAYKALAVLKEQGEVPSWGSMILGQYENGSILRNGSALSVAGHNGAKGTTVNIDLKSKMTHIICAGSRAGKGVMTLNFLASAISSNKTPFYIDRKPDMASLMKELVNSELGLSTNDPPAMFVLNGATYSSHYDIYGQWANQDSFINRNNIPDELLKITGTSRQSIRWAEGSFKFGDIFYMRAICLIVGLALSRGIYGEQFCLNPLNGGKDGIMLIIDEVSNYQDSYISILTKMMENMPPLLTLLEKMIDAVNAAKLDVESATKDTQKAKAQAAVDAKKRTINRLFSSEKFYALSFLTAIRNDLTYLYNKKNAAFDKTSLATTDILEIGQDVDYVPLDSGMLGMLIDTERYNQETPGVPRSAKNISASISSGRQSFLESIVTFQNADAMFGRNDKPYLAKDLDASPAKTRLTDSARYFAYIPEYDQSTHQRISTLPVAQSAIYFKPYLILNNCIKGNKGEGDYYEPKADTAAAELMKNSRDNGISYSSLVDENGDGVEADDTHPNGKFLHPEIGFIEYMKSIGAENIIGTLTNSAVIADHVVRDFLGYTGDQSSNIPLWLQFVTDLRMEWIFSIQDVVEGAGGNITAGRKDNPIFKEYYQFLDYMSSIDGARDLSGMDDFVAPEIDEADGNEVYNKAYEEARLTDALGLNDELDWDEEIPGIIDGEGKSGWSDDEEEGTHAYDSIDSEYNRVGSVLTNEELEGKSGLRKGDIDKIFAGAGSYSPEKYTVVSPIAETMPDGSIRNTSEEGTPIDIGDTIKGVRIDTSTEQNYYNSFAKLRELFTGRMIAEYGSDEDIWSVVELGGSIAINRVRYNGKVNSSWKDVIPYDIRAQVNSGQINRMVDWSRFLQCPNIRELSFDSKQDLEYFVAPMLDFPDNWGPATFFRRFKKLDTLIIGGAKFSRRALEDDVLRNGWVEPTKSFNVAFACHRAAKNANQNVWDFTKRFAKNPDNPWLIKALGLVVLGGASVATAAARGVTASATGYAGEAAIRKSVGAGRESGVGKTAKKIGRFGSALAQGFKDAWNDTKD